MTAPSAGRVGRRRPLPNGRAVAGGFFVAAAVVVVFAAWLTGTAHKGATWVIATQDLPAGARLSSADLATATMELPDQGAGRLAFHEPGALEGRVLAAPLEAGELVQAGDLATGSGVASLRPVTVEVASTDATDLSIGTEVDVLVTDGSDPSSPTAVVVTGARVLGIGDSSSTLDTGSAGPQITLGVSTLAQVIAVIHATQTGTIAVVVGAPGDQVTPAAGAGS